MRIARSITTAIITVNALVGVSACAGSDEPSSAGSGGTSTSTTKADGSNVDPQDFVDLVNASLNDTSFVTTMDMGATGAMRLTVDTHGGTIRFEGTMDLEDMKLSMIRVDQKIYMNMGELTPNKYFALDPSDPNDTLAQQFGDLDSANPATESVIHVS